MKSVILIWLVSISLTPDLFGQSYAPYETGVPGFTQGGTSWGDYDNDGFLDLVVNGLDETGTTATSVYRNNSGQFVLAASLPGFINGSLMWGDMDNDDDLDLLVCGADNSGNGNTIIFCNDNGVFNPLPFLFKGIASGKAIWLDYNNDNLLDIILTGDSFYNNPVAKLYRNEGSGLFTEVSGPFMAMLSSFVSAGDFDNDGDTDVLLAGDDGYGLFSTILYRNDHGVFVETSLFFDGVYSGDGLFLDYDKDEDLDILYMGGIHGGLYIFRIYANNGDGTFSKITNTIEGEWVGRIETTDLNLDGFPDLGVTGALCCGDALTAFYLNNGQGNFDHLALDLPPLTFSQLSFGDIDNDGDSDFILNGLPPEVGTIPFTKVYRNQANSNLFSQNIKPEPPQQLAVEISGNSVQFQFQMPEITYGGEAGYTYNLRIGTYPGGSDVFSGMSNPETGYCKMFKPGNIGQNMSWTANNLIDGTYYWSVQTIDLSGYASEFAGELSFVVSTTGIEQNSNTSSVNVYPSPFEDFIEISYAGPFGLTICDYLGRELTIRTNLQNHILLETQNLISGLYFLKIYNDQYEEIRKVIKY